MAYPSPSPSPQGGGEQAWKSTAALIGRLVFAAVFLMATAFKFKGIEATAGYIAGAGFPFSLLLAWVAAFFELALVLAFLSGAFFAEAALLAAIYVIFLGFAFHLSGWGEDELGQMKFGAFVSHFPFAAGLLFAAANGPGKWAMKMGWIQR
jgi:uncharacterized membrane protein YphA (DoxX/SURF4 family)